MKSSQHHISRPAPITSPLPWLRPKTAVESYSNDSHSNSKTGIHPYKVWILIRRTNGNSQRRRPRQKHWLGRMQPAGCFARSWKTWSMPARRVPGWRRSRGHRRAVARTLYQLNAFSRLELEIIRGRMVTCFEKAPIEFNTWLALPTPCRSDPYVRLYVLTASAPLHVEEPPAGERLTFFIWLRWVFGVSFVGVSRSFPCMFVGYFCIYIYILYIL